MPLPEFIPIQKPKLVAAPPLGPEWVHEAKLDGDRMQLRVVGGQPAWRSRTGTDRSAWFPDLAAAAAQLPDCILDGELCALEAGRPSFSLLQARLGARRRGQVEGELSFFAFDLLFGQGELLLQRPLSERRERLAAVLHAGRAAGFLKPTPPAPSVDPLGWARRQGLEGVVSKRLDAPYRPGGRTPEWRKAKWRPSQEVVIGGWAMTGDKFRSLLVGVYDQGRLRYVGRVGTGFDRAAVADLLPRLERLQTERCPFALGEPPRAASAVRWAQPKLVANVAFAEWTRAGQLRQASFQGLRDDKAPEEVVAERPG